MDVWNEFVSIGLQVFENLVNFFNGLAMPMRDFFGDNTFLFDVISTILSVFGFDVSNLSILGLIFTLGLAFWVVLHVVRFFRSLIG